MSPPRFVCEGVTVRYGAVTAVEDFSFRLDAGEVYGLLGPNGAGKSSLFKAITGRAPSAAGSMQLDGVDVAGEVEHKLVRAGIVGTHQTPLLFGGLTVAENVALGARVRRLDGAALEDLVEMILAQVGLAERRSDRAADLTLYDMRLLEIARALSTAPKLLLLDESLAGIRDEDIPAMLSVVRDVAKGGVTIVMVEHIVDVIEGATKHVFLMDHGRLVADAPTEAIRMHPQFRGIYLGSGAA
jgi:ABC-type branched-subunit amino acid transport system ATPase component